MAIVGSVVTALDGMKEPEGGHLYPLYRALCAAQRMSDDVTAALEPVVILDPEGQSSPGTVTLPEAQAD